MSEAGLTAHQCACEICQAGGDEVTRRYHQQINLLLSRLTEPQRRWYVGVLSAAADSPSDRQLALITGVDEKTIQRGRPVRRRMRDQRMDCRTLARRGGLTTYKIRQAVEQRLVPSATVVRRLAQRLGANPEAALDLAAEQIAHLRAMIILRGHQQGRHPRSQTRPV